jgi:hypothetical protein
MIGNGSTGIEGSSTQASSKKFAFHWGISWLLLKELYHASSLTLTCLMPQWMQTSQHYFIRRFVLAYCLQRLTHQDWQFGLLCRDA